MILLLLAMLAQPQPISTGKAVAVLSVAAAADQWTTGWAIQRGATEVNPLGASVEQRMALQMAFVGAGALAVHRLSVHHPKGGKRLLVALVLVKVSFAAWNVRQGLRR